MTTEPTKAAISTSATRATVRLLPSGQPRTNASMQTTTKNAAMTAAVHNGSATTAARSKAEPTRPDITPTHRTYSGEAIMAQRRSGGHLFRSDGRVLPETRALGAV